MEQQTKTSISNIIKSNSAKKDNSVESMMDKVSKDILEVRYITKENSKLIPTNGGFVSLIYQGITYARVNFYRTFPFTEPTKYISVREVDEKAREIGIIHNLNDLTLEQKDLVTSQLNIRYFTPIIETVLNMKQEYGYAYFDVNTNYGHCKFAAHISNASVVTLSESRILLIDIDGNRFEIPDLNKLSSNERKKLELLL